jgi:DNA-binding LacI/PurR family transcriptional regulator
LDRDLLVFVYDPDSPKDLHNLVLEKGLSGVLLLDNVGAGALAHLNRFGIPYIQVNWYINGYPDQTFVKTDLAEAVRMGFDHLYRQGYRDIGLIHWEDVLRQDDVASKAFQACLAAKGLPPDPGRIAPLQTDAVATLLEPRHRAYLCLSYFISQHIYAHCQKEGLRIPEDLALVSYEFFEFYDFLKPRLTGIRQQGHLIGRVAVDMLVERMAGRSVRSRLIPPELLVRESC